MEIATRGELNLYNLLYAASLIILSQVLLWKVEGFAYCSSASRFGTSSILSVCTNDRCNSAENESSVSLIFNEFYLQEMSETSGPHESFVALLAFNLLGGRRDFTFIQWYFF